MQTIVRDQAIKIDTMINRIACLNHLACDWNFKEISKKNPTTIVCVCVLNMFWQHDVQVHDQPQVKPEVLTYGAIFLTFIYTPIYMHASIRLYLKLQKNKNTINESKDFYEMHLLF